MAAMKTILVPVDFSRTSEVAFGHAVELARQTRSKLLLVHVITDQATMVPLPMREEFFRELETEARKTMTALTKRKKLEPKDCRLVLLRGGDPARLIAAQAKKSRVSMIVMGSQGRTGLQRLVLGSVAEKTLRYADCPVLIVKK